MIMPIKRWTNPEVLKERLTNRADSLFVNAFKYMYAPSANENITLVYKITKPKLSKNIVLNHSNDVLHFINEWRDVETLGFKIHWEVKNFRGLSGNEFPKEIQFRNIEDIYRFISLSDVFNRRKKKLCEIVSVGKSYTALLDKFINIDEFEPNEFQAFLSFIKFFKSNPDKLQGVSVRKFGIEKVDSKFVERNIPLLTFFFKTIGRQCDPTKDKFEERFLFKKKASLFFHIKDKSHLISPFTEVLVPINVLKETRVSFENVVIVENKAVYEELPAIDNIIIVFGVGNAVNSLKASQVLNMANILYFGDIDQAGFMILNSLRSRGLDVTSGFMDKTTITEYYDYKSEDQSTDVQNLDFLTDTELEAFAYAKKYNLRIEQEFVDTDKLLNKILSFFGDIN
jgi:hypothetical protein